MFSSPPLSFIHIPFDVLRVIINDAFCEAPHMSALKATISGTHVTEVLGETQGWRLWDQAPSGVWEKVVTPLEGEVFRTDLQPTYHPHGPLWGIEFSLAPPQSQTSLHQNGQNCQSWTLGCKPRVNSPHP